MSKKMFIYLTFSRILLSLSNREEVFILHLSTNEGEVQTYDQDKFVTFLKRKK